MKLILFLQATKAQKHELFFCFKLKNMNFIPWLSTFEKNRNGHFNKTSFLGRS
eukprot:UN23245